MSNKNKEYVLTYGFRRLNACKKLGWKNVPCIIVSTKEVKDIPIDDILVAEEDNSRYNESGEDISELMQSIKQHGLLEPIGVMDSKSLTAEEFILLNATENIHRKNPTPFEYSIIIKKLRNFGMGMNEISVRLALPLSTVATLSRLTNKIEKDIMRESSFSRSKKQRAGKIPIAVIGKIAHLRVADADKKYILSKAKSEEFTVGDIEIISDLISRGKSAKDAIAERHKYDTTLVKVVLIKEVMKRHNLPKKNMTKLINSMLIGKTPLIPELIFFSGK